MDIAKKEAKMTTIDKFTIAVCFSVMLIVESFAATSTLITPDGRIIMCTTDENNVTICI